MELLCCKTPLQLVLSDLFFQPVQLNSILWSLRYTSKTSMNVFKQNKQNKNSTNCAEPKQGFFRMFNYITITTTKKWTHILPPSYLWILNSVTCLKRMQSIYSLLYKTWLNKPLVINLCLTASMSRCQIKRASQKESFFSLSLSIHNSIFFWLSFFERKLISYGKVLVGFI